MSYQIGPGMFVVLAYRVFDEEGEALHDEPDQLSLVVGYGGLEDAAYVETLGAAEVDAGQSIARTLERKFVRVALGGVRCRRTGHRQGSPWRRR